MEVSENVLAQPEITTMTTSLGTTEAEKISKKNEDGGPSSSRQGLPHVISSYCPILILFS